MILKQIVWSKCKGGRISVVVTGWLVALTKGTFLAEPAGDSPVDSILLFVDILLAPNTSNVAAPNTDKQLRSTLQASHKHFIFSGAT